MKVSSRLVQRRVYTPSNGRTIDTIVIHQYNTPQAAGTYEQTINWLYNSAPVSIHYVVSGRRMTRMVREKDIAWHAMESNGRSIGIEFDPNNMDYNYAGQVVAWVAKRHNVSVSRILSHNQAMVAGTRCPATIDWRRIKNNAKTILEGDEMITRRGLNVLFLFLCGILPNANHRSKYIGKYTFDAAYAEVLKSNAHARYKRQRLAAFKTIEANTSARIGRIV